MRNEAAQPFVPIPDIGEFTRQANESAVQLYRPFTARVVGTHGCGSEESSRFYLLERHTCYCGNVFLLRFVGECGEQKTLSVRGIDIDFLDSIILLFVNCFLVFFFFFMTRFVDC